MEDRKRAWVYCSMDAPEDRQGALKRQRQQLIGYAKQMEFELAGSSSDTGMRPLWERTGFRAFTEAVRNGRVDILIIANQNSLTRSSMQLAQLQALIKGCGIKIYSPMHGLMNF